MTTTGTTRRYLVDLRQDLIAELHPTLNGDIDPSKLTPGSARKLWWLGPCGHEWDAAINNRTNGSNCPFCSNTRVLAGFNDLASQRPDLAAQWHPTKNVINPAAISPKSNKKAWWVCPEGHEWEANIGNRFYGNGCPVCKVPRGGEFAAAKRARRALGLPVKHREKVAGKLPQGLLPGINDMETIRPDLALEFHPTKNAPSTPATTSAGTGARLWWRCEEGHEWQQTGNARTSMGLGCPKCGAQAAIESGKKRSGSGRRLHVGINDLASRRPDVAAQWHPTRNGDLAPSDVTSSTGVKAWWLDEFGHEWESVIASRTGGGVGCPICSGHKTLAGFNDLATVRPDVAAEWHRIKNGELLPSVLTQFSNRIVWWECTKGHEWKSTVNNRSHEQGCPVCADRGFQQSKPGFVYFLEHRGLRSFKVGITNEGTVRLDLFQIEGWTILNLERFQNGAQALQVESAIKRWWRKDLGLPMWLGPEDMARTSGWTETISSDELTARECIERIRTEAAALRLPVPHQFP
ncbi:zinc-ribbon domain-containing protein [Curtobacterium sp. PhB136]|uniref:zinc-ribbon domain-containing protein n=1 Tax=Curtobacterium sp. PhB136 TaxID=2485181 RepID=UPI00104DAA8E|nr:zinc-ribbon domain-containing protein [Curtobacterium sp. PhB136]TCK63132.1 putative zinc ribbon protein [Curtobacterium sp. PhB136]